VTEVSVRTWSDNCEVYISFSFRVYIHTRTFKVGTVSNFFRIIRIFGCFRKIVKSDYWFRHACLPAYLSVRPSVCPHEMTRLRLHGFSWILIFEYFSKMHPEKSKFHENLTSMTGTLHEDLSTFMVISRSIHLRLRNVSDKSCRENQKHILCSTPFVPNFLPFLRHLGWKSMVESDKPQMMVCCDMAHAHCMLDNENHRHTQHINTCCSSTATVVTWTRASVTFYVHCMYWWTRASVTFYVHCMYCYYRTLEIQT